MVYPVAQMSAGEEDRMWCDGSAPRRANPLMSGAKIHIAIQARLKGGGAERNTCQHLKPDRPASESYNDTFRGCTWRPRWPKGTDMNVCTTSAREKVGSVGYISLPGGEARAVERFIGAPWHICRCSCGAAHNITLVCPKGFAGQTTGQRSSLYGFTVSPRRCKPQHSTAVAVVLASLAGGNWR